MAMDPRNENNPQTLVVEIGLQEGPAVRNIHKFTQFPVRIGRGFDNDITLTDPFISPSHITIAPQGQEGWIVEDLGSENGVFINRKSYRGQKVPVRTGDDILLGKTHIRVFSGSHALPETERLDQSNEFLRRISRRGISTAIFIATLGAMAGYAYLESWSLKPSAALGIGLMALAWAALWGVAGKILRHRARLHGHISVIGLFLLTLLTAGYAFDYLRYLSNDSVPALAFEALSSLGFFIVLIYAHLSLASPARRHRRWQIASYTGLGLAAGLSVFAWIDHDRFDPMPNYSWYLMPHLQSLAPAYTPEEFLRQTQDVFIFENET